VNRVGLLCQAALRRRVNILWAMLHEDLREHGVDCGGCTRDDGRSGSCRYAYASPCAGMSIFLTLPMAVSISWSSGRPKGMLFIAW
jgi:hypothetical protein